MLVQKTREKWTNSIYVTYTEYGEGYFSKKYISGRDGMPLSEIFRPPSMGKKFSSTPIVTYCTWYVLQTGEMTCWNTGTICFFFSVNWGAHWFEYFPNPPINILAMIENVLAHHDKYLLQHFVKYGVTSQVHFLNRKLLTWYSLFMKEKDFQKKYWYMYEWFEQTSGQFCWMQCLFIWSVQCSVDFCLMVFPK